MTNYEIYKKKRELLGLSSNGKLNSRKKIIYRSSSPFLPRQSQDCLYSKSFHTLYLQCRKIGKTYGLNSCSYAFFIFHLPVDTFSHCLKLITKRQDIFVLFENAVTKWCWNNLKTQFQIIGFAVNIFLKQRLKAQSKMAPFFAQRGFYHRQWVLEVGVTEHARTFSNLVVHARSMEVFCLKLLQQNE